MATPTSLMFVDTASAEQSRSNWWSAYYIELHHGEGVSARGITKSDIVVCNNNYL